MIEKLIWIAAGGAMGSVCRFLTAAWGAQICPTFPLGTMLVNILGCFCIGIAGGYFLANPNASEVYRLALITGFLGGYTTFSAFGWETVLLAVNNRIEIAILNVAINNGLGILAVVLGMKAAPTLFGQA